MHAIDKIDAMLKELAAAHDRVINPPSMDRQEDMRRSIIQLSEVFKQFLKLYKEERVNFLHSCSI
jgi:hypothetical protein